MYKHIQKGPDKTNLWIVSRPRVVVQRPLVCSTFRYDLPRRDVCCGKITIDTHTSTSTHTHTGLRYCYTMSPSVCFSRLVIVFKTFFQLCNDIIKKKILNDQPVVLMPYKNYNINTIIVKIKWLKLSTCQDTGTRPFLFASEKIPPRR